MSGPNPSKTAILYQNPSQTVTLLDLPTSISLAQHSSDDSDPTLIIYSSPPLHSPYPSTEPKTKAAKANVIRMLGAQPPGFSESQCREALEEIRANWKGTWCLPRRSLIHEPIRREKKRRKHGCDDEGSFGDGTTQDRGPVIDVPWCNYRKAKIPRALALNTGFQNAFPEAGSFTNNVVYNPENTPATLLVGPDRHQYRIPPNAAFYMSNINERNIDEFSESMQSFFPGPSATAGPGQLDLIVLDPPWENRSVYRAGKYNTIQEGMDPVEALQSMLYKHLAPRTLVACWVTNKKSVQDRAKALLGAWDVDLIEEWAWLKTTVDGQPVVAIDGLWRKPYELLLLGRHVDQLTGTHTTPNRLPSEIQRKVVVAVPDIHSRKPCLKELIQQMMPHPASYRALEVFARNLTAGWCSWGNEVIKYNWEGYWTKTDELESARKNCLDDAVIGLDKTKERSPQL